MKPADPLRKLRLPRTPQVVKPALTREEFALLYRLALSTRDKWRNRALLSFGVETGCRVSEICALRSFDVDLASARDHGRALINGKGSKQRYCWYGGDVSRDIRKYWDVERPKQSGEPWAFLGHDGHQLTPRAVQAMLHDLATAAHLARPVSPHTLRRTMASWKAASGVNAFAIQTQLGHTSMQMTRRYIDGAQLADGSGFSSLLDGWRELR